MKEKSKRKLLEWLISLGITAVMLVLVVAGLYWYMSVTHMELDMKTVWIGNAIGGLLMLLIVHHFVKAPKQKGYRQ